MKTSHSIAIVVVLIVPVWASSAPPKSPEGTSVTDPNTGIIIRIGRKGVVEALGRDGKMRWSRKLPGQVPKKLQLDGDVVKVSPGGARLDILTGAESQLSGGVISPRLGTIIIVTPVEAKRARRMFAGLVAILRRKETVSNYLLISKDRKPGMAYITIHTDTLKKVVGLDMTTMEPGIMVSLAAIDEGAVAKMQGPAAKSYAEIRSNIASTARIFRLTPGGKDKQMEAKLSRESVFVIRQGKSLILEPNHELWVHFTVAKLIKDEKAPIPEDKIAILMMFYLGIADKMGPKWEQALREARATFNRTQRALADSDQAISQKHYPQAIKLLCQVLVDYPAWPAADLAAKRLAGLSSSDPSLRTLIEQTKIDHPAAALEAKAKAAEEKKDYRQAIKLYEDYLKKYRIASRFKQVKAHLEALRSNSTVRAAIFNKTADREGAAKLQLAENYANAGLRDKARAILKQIIEKYPGTKWAKEAAKRLK